MQSGSPRRCAVGEDRGTYLPLSAIQKELLELAEAEGFGAADNSAVIKAFQLRLQK